MLRKFLYRACVQAGGMIEVRGVYKSFGKARVLEDVSFSVRNGEVVGFVGLNGAGKTTTIRITVGVLPPDAGDVFIDGYSVSEDKVEASARVGWVPELPIFESEYRALDYFAYLAGYYGYSEGEARRLGRELFERVGIGEAANKRLEEFSQGMKKRFALAVSLINDPPNFLFDEVLNGLDPQGIAFFRGLVQEFRKAGKAVLFSSHILSEVEGLADRVVFIHRGRIVGTYTMDEIRRRASGELLVSVSPLDDGAASIAARYGEPEKRGNALAVKGFSGDPSSLVAELVAAGYRVAEVKRSEKSLEEFFFELVGLRGDGA